MVTVFARFDLQHLKEIVRLHEEGAFKVRIHRTFPLSGAPAAQREMAERLNRGKLVILPHTR